MISFEEHTNDEILIFKILAGEADTLELKSFQERCTNDDTFRTMYIEMKELWENSDALHKVQNVNADKAILNVNTRIDKLERRNKVRQFVIWGSTIAAFLVFGVFGFKTFVGNRPIEIVTTNNVLNLLLPDSSVVILNSHSKFVYQRKFRGSIRAVSLSGEAYFKVKSDKQQPFIITATKACVKVLGTEFNVSTTGEYTNVLVTNGRVILYSKSDASKQVMLSGGEKGSFSTRDETVSKEPISEINFNSWVTGVFKFDQTRLSDAIVVLEQYYRTKILIRDETIANYKISATFNRESLTSILQVMEVTFNVKAEQKDSVVWIVHCANK